jgi:hypothetical protein
MAGVEELRLELSSEGVLLNQLKSDRLNPLSIKFLHFALKLLYLHLHSLLNLLQVLYLVLLRRLLLLTLRRRRLLLCRRLLLE